MARLIAFEGIDGSGKGTQSRRLHDRIERLGRRTELISFPRYADTLFGRVIGDYLNGRFGRLEEVSPFVVALLFAGDRFESRRMIEESLQQNDLLILDRYVASNVAHQAAKLQEPAREEFVRWIEHIEFDVFGLPRPDLVILLDIPVEMARQLIARKGQRGYTDKPADLQEADGDYLGRVRDAYLELAAADDRWRTVACTESGRMRSVESISEEIRGLVDET